MVRYPLSTTTLKNTRALADCSIMLYVMTERWPATRKYRKIFEGIKGSVLDLIAAGTHQPRTVVRAITNDVRTTLQSMNFFPSKPLHVSQLVLVVDPHIMSPKAIHAILVCPDRPIYPNICTFLRNPNSDFTLPPSSPHFKKY
jgi:hypothetical protein